MTFISRLRRCVLWLLTFKHPSLSKAALVSILASWKLSYIVCTVGVGTLERFQPLDGGNPESEPPHCKGGTQGEPWSPLGHWGAVSALMQEVLLFCYHRAAPGMVPCGREELMHCPRVELTAREQRSSEDGRVERSIQRACCFNFSHLHVYMCITRIYLYVKENWSLRQFCIVTM